MDCMTIVNYQGSKKNLLEFIHKSLGKYLKNDDVILDIFAGTSSVAYSYKNDYKVYANDAEPYAAAIGKALLGSKIDEKSIARIASRLNDYLNVSEDYEGWRNREREYIENEDIDSLTKLYSEIPTVWKDGNKYFNNESEYSLFLKYYSTSYFGIEQARDIDALRYAIEMEQVPNKDAFMACLFYAMKECVFSKDGHMAQPLDLKKNKSRLLKLRKKDIKELFFIKCEEFRSEAFVDSTRDNRVFNCNFEDLLEEKESIEDVTVIYADPPYTDMQYSRYYHLLNTALEYDYPDLTVSRGQYTKGLYLENRFQSQLSKKSQCLESMSKLIEYCHKHNILLAISFAYPQDTVNQKTDRYVMDINDLIEECQKKYNKNRVHVLKKDYKHSNNRNSESKQVLEYLIICEREG